MPGDEPEQCVQANDKDSDHNEILVSNEYIGKTIEDGIVQNIYSKLENPLCSPLPSYIPIDRL